MYITDSTTMNNTQLILVLYYALDNTARQYKNKMIDGLDTAC